MSSLFSCHIIARSRIPFFVSHNCTHCLHKSILLRKNSYWKNHQRFLATSRREAELENLVILETEWRKTNQRNEKGKKLEQMMVDSVRNEIWAGRNGGRSPGKHLSMTAWVIIIPVNDTN